MIAYTQQESHYIAMTFIGKELEKRGFEFLAINSQLKKHPQYICIDKDNRLHFILIKVIFYPENPSSMDRLFIENFKKHAKTKKAKVLYAGVGIANAEDIEKPVQKNQDYIINFDGFQEIL